MLTPSKMAKVPRDVRTNQWKQSSNNGSTKQPNSGNNDDDDDDLQPLAWRRFPPQPDNTAAGTHVYAYDTYDLVRCVDGVDDPGSMLVGFLNNKSDIICAVVGDHEPSVTQSPS